MLSAENRFKENLSVRSQIVLSFNSDIPILKLCISVGEKKRSDEMGFVLVLLCHPKVDLQQLPEEPSGDGDESFPS